MKLEFSERFSKYIEMRSFVEICPAETELFRAERHTYGRTDRRDEANSRSSQVLRARPKLSTCVCNFYL